jgi:hypothetical protein
MEAVQHLRSIDLLSLISTRHRGRTHRIEPQIVMKGGHEPVCPPFARNRTEQRPEKAAVRFGRVSQSRRASVARKLNFRLPH